jgi:hypothetical protein
MRRFGMVGAVLVVGTVLAVLTPMAGSTAAWANGPQHVKSTSTVEMTFEAGTFCDFTYRLMAKLSENQVIFTDRTIDQIEADFTHTNLDAGFTLTEVDHITLFAAADGQTKFVGLLFHLRNADGKLVVVQAGQLVFSATDEVLKFTPNADPDNAAVVCPALGGQPAS